MQGLVCFPTPPSFVALPFVNGAGLSVIIAGQPLDQPVIQYGPFVLNTKEEVYEALLDYQSNSNGFERAKGWKSEIAARMR